MMARTAALLLAACASAAPAQRIPNPSAERTTALRQVRLADLVGEFERLCLATGFDHDRFAAAVGRSPWRFSAQTGPESEDIRQAPEAVLVFNQPPIEEGRSYGPPQCNMEAATLQVESRAAVVAAIEPALTRLAGTVPPRHARPGETCWRWTPVAEQVLRLCLMDRPGMAAQQIALSFQRWTQRAEARAHLTPPAGESR
jgi:hypothetical protein